MSAVVYPESEEELVNVVKLLSLNDLPYIVVGKMANILFKDQVYDGIVVKSDKIAKYTVAENRICASCGASVGKLIREMSKRDLGGMEGLCGIPGTVGGMLRQNAGAFGYEISDTFIEAVCYDPQAKAVRVMSRSDMSFAYRDCILSKEKLIILNATFELVQKKQSQILDEIRMYREKRIQSQPYEFPSLGSVFKRYNGTSAAYYIDRAGLKGFSIGGACVSTKHAGFIVNTGGATAFDYLRLIDHIKTKVNMLFGIELEEEIEIVQ